MQWKNPQSPNLKIGRALSSAGKVMVTVFFHYDGVLLLDLEEPSLKINT